MRFTYFINKCLFIGRKKKYMKDWFKPLYSPVTKKGRQVRLWAISITAGVLLLTLVFTSGLLAAPLITPTVIYACVNNQSNTPRVITTNANVQCSPNETKLNWNQEGPTGPQGPKGDPGQNGLSKGYSAESNSPLILQPIPSEPATEVVSVNVPAAGNYMVYATVTSDINNTDLLGTKCFISTTQMSVDQSTQVGSPSSRIQAHDQPWVLTWPIVGSISISSGSGPFKISLFCGSQFFDIQNPLQRAKTSAARITAIQLNTIN